MHEDRPHYVILSVDAMPGTRAEHAALQPPKVGEWTQTEGDEEYEFGYLGEEYENGLHRKWTAALTDAELDDWLQDECYADRADAREHAERTMGMITEYGHLPAYSIRDEPGAWNIGGYDPVIDRNAYVGEYALSETVPADARETLSDLYGLEPSDH